MRWRSSYTSHRSAGCAAPPPPGGHSGGPTGGGRGRNAEAVPVVAPAFLRLAADSIDPRTAPTPIRALAIRVLNEPSPSKTKDTRLFTSALGFARPVPGCSNTKSLKKSETPLFSLSKYPWLAPPELKIPPELNSPGVFFLNIPDVFFLMIPDVFWKICVTEFFFARGRLLDRASMGLPRDVIDPLRGKGTNCTSAAPPGVRTGAAIER